MFGAPRDAPTKIRKCTWTLEELQRHSNGAWLPMRKRSQSMKMSQHKASMEAQRLPRSEAPFRGLPAEIRNEIYQHYFSGQTWYVQDRMDYFGPKGTCPGLLLASRQAYYEAGKFRYSHGTISISHRDHFEQWVVANPQAQLASITRLEYRISLHWSYGIPSGYRHRAGGILKELPNARKLSIQVTSQTESCRYTLSTVKGDTSDAPYDLQKILLEKLRPWGSNPYAECRFPEDIMVRESSKPHVTAYLTPEGQSRKYAAESDQDSNATVTDSMQQFSELCVKIFSD